MDNILVTGATGFIGQRLLRALEGNIKILSRKKNQYFHTIICNLEKESIPRNSLNNIDTVFHLAGFAHDLFDEDNSRNIYQKVNVDATLKLARLAIKSGVKRFVFVSSVKAGGRSIHGICANEEDQNEPEGTYGKTKRQAEIELLKIGKRARMHLTIIRPALVYGPNVKGNLQLMLSGIKKGWFPPLPEIENKRSMIHVDDLVRVILLVSEDSRANGEIFIATDAKPYSSREIYEAMCDAIGKPIPSWHVPRLLFDFLAMVNPRIKYKIDKLLGDDFYSSEKLKSLGFNSQRVLKEMNETSF